MFLLIKRPISGGWPSQVTKASLRFMSASMPVIPGAALPSSILTRTSPGSSGNIRGDLQLVAPTRSLYAPLTWRAMSRTPGRNHLPQMVPLDTMASIYPLYSKTRQIFYFKTQQKVSVFDLAMDCTSEGTAKRKRNGWGLIGGTKGQIGDGCPGGSESKGEGYTGISFTYRTVTATYDSVFAPACR